MNLIEIYDHWRRNYGTSEEHRDSLWYYPRNTGIDQKELLDE